MDSRPDTYKHILMVQKFLNEAIQELMDRGRLHDASKLESPEREAFDEITPRLAGTTYGSDEYRATLREMKPAINHHQQNNQHHPEYFNHYKECNGCFKQFPRDFDGRCDVCGYGQFTDRPGFRGMSLIDLVEMICDWKAASLRHNDGDIRRSVEVNQERFGYSDDVKQILLNTVEWLECVFDGEAA